MDSTSGNADGAPPIIRTLGDVNLSKYAHAHFGEIVTVRKHNGLQAFTRFS